MNPMNLSEIRLASIFVPCTDNIKCVCHQLELSMDEEQLDSYALFCDPNPHDDIESHALGSPLIKQEVILRNKPRLMNFKIILEALESTKYVISLCVIALGTAYHLLEFMLKMILIYVS
eukprot:264086_1